MRTSCGDGRPPSGTAWEAKQGTGGWVAGCVCGSAVALFENAPGRVQLHDKKAARSKAGSCIHAHCKLLAAIQASSHLGTPPPSPAAHRDPPTPHPHPTAGQCPHPHRRCALCARRAPPGGAAQIVAQGRAGRLVASPVSQLYNRAALRLLGKLSHPQLLPCRTRAFAQSSSAAC